MRKLAVAVALLGIVGMGAFPAYTDCIYDMQKAKEAVDSMPDGRAKQMATRELKMAMEAAVEGDEKMCLVHVGVCAQYTGR